MAFVLSGGASLGAIQVGMLRALYERGVAPDLIVGTSAGALNGAYIASRPQASATAESLARIWRELRRGQVFPVNPLTGLLGFLGARDHLVPDSGLRRLIERHVECQGLEEMPIPLHVVAVDVVTGEELRLSSGPVLEAVLASAAVPGVLRPVPWEGRALMDGGVANNTPISHAVELGAERIYVLPTGHACALTEPPGGALAMALHAVSLLTHRRLIDDIERHPRRRSADRHAAALPARHPADRFRPRGRAHGCRAARRTRVPRQRGRDARTDTHARAPTCEPSRAGNGQSYPWRCRTRRATIRAWEQRSESGPR